MSLLPYIFEDHSNRSILSWPSLISFRDEDFFKSTSLSTLWDQLTGIQKDIKIDKEKFEANINVRHYKPEEITVKLTGKNTVTIAGKHEEKPEHGYVSRQFVRHFTLPEDCDSEKLQTKISADGVLVLSVPKKSEDDRLQITELPPTPTETCRKTFDSRSMSKTSERGCETPSLSESRVYQKKEDDSFQYKQNRMNVNESVSKTSERRTSITSTQGGQQHIVAQVPTESEESRIYRKKVENSYQIRENGVLTESKFDRSDETKSSINNVESETRTSEQSSTKHQNQTQDRRNQAESVQKSDESRNVYYENETVRVQEAPKVCEDNNLYQRRKNTNNLEQTDETRIYQQEVNDRYQVQQNTQESVQKSNQTKTAYKNVQDEQIYIREIPVESPDINQKRIDNSFQVTDSQKYVHQSVNTSRNNEHEREQVRQIPVQYEAPRTQETVDDSFRLQENRVNVNQTSQKINQTQTTVRTSENENVYVRDIPVQYEKPKTQERIVNQSSQKINESQTTYKSGTDNLRPVPDQNSAVYNQKIDNSFHIKENVQTVKTNTGVHEIPVQYEENRTNQQNVNESVRKNESKTSYKAVDEQIFTRDIPVQYEDKTKVQSKKVDDSFYLKENNVSDSRNVNQSKTSYRTVEDERVYVREVPVDSKMCHQSIDSSFQIKQNGSNISEHVRSNETKSTYNKVEDNTSHVRQVPIVSEESRIYKQNINNVQVQESGIKESVKRADETRNSSKNVQNTERVYVTEVPVYHDQCNYNKTVDNSFHVKENRMNVSESVRRSDGTTSSYNNYQEEKVYGKDVPVQSEQSKMYQRQDDSSRYQQNKTSNNETVRKSNESKVFSEKTVRETPLNFTEQVSKSQTIKKQTEVQYREVPINMTGAVRQNHQYVSESESQKVRKVQY